MSLKPEDWQEFLALAAQTEVPESVLTNRHDEPAPYRVLKEHGCNKYLLKKATPIDGELRSRRCRRRHRAGPSRLIARVIRLLDPLGPNHTQNRSLTLCPRALGWRFPSPFPPSSMPARHRHHHSSERRKSFTITLESCTRSAGICVHDALETVTTMDRNMQL